MIYLFYALSIFPALAWNFGVGNVPLRYFSVALGIFSLRFSRLDILFLIAAVSHLCFCVALFFIRPFSLLDISYFIAYIYVFVGVAFVRASPVIFRRFVYFFWLVNLGYACAQQVLLVWVGDQNLALMHQNTHHFDYVIPPIEFFPYLFRVTGLFVESAPFVIYLIFTHFAFLIFESGKFFKFLNIVAILFAGAKVGYLFIVLYFICYVLSVLRVSFFFVLFLLGVVFIFFAPVVIDFVGGLGVFPSVLIRLSWFYELLLGFYSDMLAFSFGNGFVSSSELMSGDFEGPVRGIDFFSTYIYSNGVVGSLLLLSPLLLWVFCSFSFVSFRDRNFAYLCLGLAFATMGSLLNFQYAYFIFVLAYASQLNGRKLRHEVSGLG